MLEKEKRDYIINNSNLNLMIEAGAGAGKTTIIIQRILNQLKNNTITPDRLIIITFTNAASNDFQARLAKGLKDEIKICTNQLEKERLMFALENQSLIQASTIHSFCFKLIKENCLYLTLPIDVELLENNATTNRINNFYNLWIKNNENEIKKFSNEFIWDKLNNILFSEFQDIAELPDDTEFIYNKNVLNNSKTIKDYINDYRLEVENNFYIAKDKYEELNNIHFDSLDEFVNNSGALKDNAKVIYNLSHSDNDFNLKTIRSNIKNSDFLYKKFFKVAKNVYCDNEIISQFSNEAYNNLLDYQKSLIISLAIKIRNDYKKFILQKENKKYISNDQSLQYVLKLVQNEELVNNFQKQHKCIYLDEYQDTDRIQKEIVYRLTRKNNKFLDGSIFLVGDPKQSIYNFRGADLALYNETIKDFNDKGHSEFINLQDNYRSENSIISWVNSSFKNKLDNYQEMTSTRNNNQDKNILNGVYNCYYTEDKPSRENEAKLVVKLINYLMSNYKIYSKENGKEILRSIKYSDFLLLSGKKTYLNIYINELKSNNIPFFLNADLNVEDDSILLKLKNYYNYLSFPYSIYKDAVEEMLNQDYINDTKNIILAKKLFDETKNLNALELLAYLTNHVELYINKDANKVDVINITSLLQQVSEYILTRCPSNKNDVVILINNLISNKIDGFLTLGENDVVRIMNVHKAKGLEGKIVFSINRGQINSKDNNALKDKNKYYPVIKIPNQNNPKAYPTYDNQDPKIKKLIDLSDESTRLEYVEATRAEEALIFFKPVVQNGPTRFNKDNYHLENSTLSLLDDDLINYLQNDDFIPNIETKEYSYNSLFKLNESQKENIYNDILPSEQDYVDTAFEKTKEKKENRPKGNIFGTIMHRCFELYINNLLNNISINKEIIINQALLENYDDILKENKNDYKNYLLKQLNIFENNNIINKIKQGKKVYTEFSFSYFENNNYYNGKIDLLIINQDNTCLIIDYKTDEKGGHSLSELEAHLVKKYTPQLEIYKTAVNKCFNIPLEKISCEFYHMYMDEKHINA